MKIPGIELVSHLISTFFRYLTAFVASVKSGEFFRNLQMWWKSDWGFILLSVAIASVIYYQVKTTISETRDVDFVLVAELTDGDADAVVSPSTESVRVRVLGAVEEVRKFETSNNSVLTIRVDKDTVVKRKPYVIRDKDIPGRKGLRLQIIDITPNNVMIEYDERIPVPFAIALPEMTGTPYHGTAKIIGIEPDVIKLRGPTKTLSSLAKEHKLKLSDINVGGRQGEIEFVCDVKIPAEIPAEPLPSDKAKVKVKVKVEPRDGTRQFKDLPLRLSLPPQKKTDSSLPQGYQLVPKSVTAKITGYEVTVDSLSNTMFTAYAYVADPSTIDRTPGATNRVPVRIEVPHDKEITDVESVPSEVLLIMPPKKDPVSEVAARLSEKETAEVGDAAPEKATAETPDAAPVPEEAKAAQAVPQVELEKENQENEGK